MRNFVIKHYLFTKNKKRENIFEMRGPNGRPATPRPDQHQLTLAQPRKPANLRNRFEQRATAAMLGRVMLSDINTQAVEVKWSFYGVRISTKDVASADGAWAVYERSSKYKV